MPPMQQLRPDPIAPNRTGTLVAFMVAHFGHHLCTTAVVPLLPMIRDSFDLDYLRSGLLLSAFSVAYGLVQLPMGAISDRFGKRLVVALGLVGTGAACVWAAFAADYAHIMLALLLMGVAGSTYHAPAVAFISETFKEARGRLLGIHIVGGALGLMVAPVVAIAVAGATGSWRNAFLVMGIPVTVAGLLVWTLAGAQESANARDAAGEKAEPLSWIWLIRVVGLLAGVAIVTQLLISGMNSFLPLYLVDMHGVPQSTAGLMMSIVFGAGVVGAPVGGAISDRFGRKPVILLSVIACGPLIYLITLFPFGAVMIGIIFFYGLFQVFRLPAIESMIADVAPARSRATALGGYNLLAQQTSGIATPLLGWLMDQYGLHTGVGVLASVALATSLLTVLLWRKV